MKGSHSQRFMNYIKRYSFVIASLLLSVGSHALTTQQKFELRQEAHNQVSINNPGTSALPILSKYGIKNDSLINSLTASYEDGNKADFTLINMVRVLFLSDLYDSQIFASIDRANFPFWLESGEDQHIYWSENHMIMWLSSDWLLNQYKGLASDENLRLKIVHFLELKRDYGFYELLSPNYFPYTLSALLNLVDFAEDSELQQLAEVAVNRLLTEVLWVTNDKGVFFSAAGRSNTDKYLNAYTANHSKVINILTGLGVTPLSASAASAFISTSDMDLTSVIESWKPVENMQITAAGHGLGDNVNSMVSKEDRVLFQWSMGGYFHPTTWDDTFWGINHYSLENHESFEDFGGFASSSIIKALGKNIIPTFTRGSDLSNLDIDVYKHNGVVLSSLDTHYGGYMGFQTWPWVATVDDIAVWTQSGEVKAEFKDRTNSTNNTHLPKVMQKNNLVMAVYWPNSEISAGNLFGAMDTTVALHWPTDEFDEIVEDGRWIIGRKNTSYIAVLRDCASKVNGQYACSGNNGRQMWGTYVGNAETYQSFDNFVDVIGRSSYYNSLDFHFSCFCNRYHVILSVDGNKIDHYWD